MKTVLATLAWSSQARVRELTFGAGGILRNLCDRSSFARSLTSFGMTKGRSENKNGIPYTYEIFHASSIPVSQANAVVTGCATDAIGTARAVYSDVVPVQTHPKDAKSIVRSWWKAVIAFGSHAEVV